MGCLWRSGLLRRLVAGTDVRARPGSIGPHAPIYRYWSSDPVWGVRHLPAHPRLLGCSSPVARLGGDRAFPASLHFLWQFAVTGDPTLNPYTLWWPYDKIGFGPGVGVLPQGHTLRIAWINTRFSLWVGSRDLFGWARYSWIFLPFGLWAARGMARCCLRGALS